MSDLTTYRTLLAWRQKRPLPLLEALPLPRVRPENTLLLAFVRMAGEAMPWGVALGHPGKAPRLLTIPEPRNMDLAAGLCLELASALLAHLGHPAHGGVDPAERQLWLPGGAHVDLLHLLSLRLTYAQKHPRAAELQALGRASGFLFRESSRPGQLGVVNASALLRALFVFPAEPSRCSHLGYQLAWLRPSADPMAEASQAELLTAGDALDPTLERDALQGLVEAWGKASKASGKASRAKVEAERAMDELLRPELLRRWRWVEEAWTRVQQDRRPENSGLDELRKLARDEHEWQYLRTERGMAGAERPFVPDPETDHGAAAAARYFASIHAQEVSEASLLRGDASRQADALAAGAILVGKVVQRRQERGSREAVLWTVEGPALDLCKLREGNDVAVAGHPGLSGKIRAMEVVGELRRVEIAFPGRQAASDRAWTGKSVVLLPASVPFFSKARSMQAWKGEGPGAWLSHDNGSAPAAGRSGDGVALLAQVRAMAAKR